MRHVGDKRGGTSTPITDRVVALAVGDEFHIRPVTDFCGENTHTPTSARARVWADSSSERDAVPGFLASVITLTDDHRV